MKNTFFLFLAVLLMQGCLNQNLTPEETLKNFIEMRIGKKVSRSDLVANLTGKMRQSFESISDEDFEKFSNLENQKQESFKIVTKSCQKDICFITYKISVHTKGISGVFESEVKKIAELKLEEGKWLISDVSNVKTYLESVDSIDITN